MHDESNMENDTLVMKMSKPVGKAMRQPKNIPRSTTYVLGDVVLPAAQIQLCHTVPIPFEMFHQGSNVSREKSVSGCGLGRFQQC